jgi:hypothetical protein
MGEDRGRGDDDDALGPGCCPDHQRGAGLPEARFVRQQPACFAKELLGPSSLEAVELEAEPVRHLESGNWRWRDLFSGRTLGWAPIGAEHGKTSKSQGTRG